MQRLLYRLESQPRKTRFKSDIQPSSLSMSGYSRFGCSGPCWLPLVSGRPPPPLVSHFHWFHLHRCEIDLTDLTAAKRPPNTRIFVKYLPFMSVHYDGCHAVPWISILSRSAFDATKSGAGGIHSKRIWLIDDLQAAGLDCGLPCDGDWLWMQAVVKVRAREHHLSSDPTRGADVTASPDFDSHKDPE